jgi:hypothetical protein
MFGYENYGSDKNMESKQTILWEIFSCFNRKMDFYLTASPSPFPCIEISWTLWTKIVVFSVFQL